ncbi:MAG: hypothetical protein ACE5LS_06315 [Thermoplasmata archaeon]
MTREEGPGSWALVVALLALLALGAGGPLLSGAPGGPSAPLELAAWRGAPDLDGPTIRDVRAVPPLARPGESVSLVAVITDPDGVQASWVLIEAPDVDLNMTLVAFGDTWYLNRSWQTPGVYGFQVWAQDGAGNLSTAPGSFQVQASLAGTLALVVLLGTLLAVGAGAILFLLVRRGSGRRG